MALAIPAAVWVVILTDLETPVAAWAAIPMDLEPPAAGWAVIPTDLALPAVQATVTSRLENLEAVSSHGAHHTFQMDR